MKNQLTFEAYILVLLAFALIYHFFITPPVHEAGHALICKIFGGEEIIISKEKDFYYTICIGKEKSVIANILYSLGGVLAEFSIPLAIIFLSLLINKKISVESELVLLALIYSIGLNFLVLSYQYDLKNILPIFVNPVPNWIVGLLLIALVQKRTYYLFSRYNILLW